MEALGSPDIRFVRVGRRLSGGEQFLADVVARCEKTLAGQALASTVEYVPIKSKGGHIRYVRQERAFPTPVYEKSRPSELELILGYWALPDDLSTRFSTRRTAVQMDDISHFRIRRRMRTEPNNNLHLSDALNQTAVSQSDSNYTSTIRCNSVVSTIAGGNKVFALSVDSSQSMYDNLQLQASLVRRRMNKIDDAIGACEDSHWRLTVPFLWVPPKVPNNELAVLNFELDALMPCSFAVGHVEVDTDKAATA